ncbi:MAG: type II toxin-antitoxin system Phd/YefM family antitoxin [Actinomycetota bacterium]
MTVADQMPLAEVKNRLSEVVEAVEGQHARITITTHGRPAAVLISIDDLTSLEETLLALSDPDLMASLRDATRELDAGLGQPLTEDQARELIKPDS